MAIRSEGDHHYGDSQQDIRDVLREYSESNDNAIHHFADAKCSCGGVLFELLTDEVQGVGARICKSCGAEHFMADGANYADEADLEDNECLCGARHFEITAGVSLYPEADGLSDTVRWFYIGCRCPNCQLLGCYADWKDEFQGYQELLDNV